MAAGDYLASVDSRDYHEPELLYPPLVQRCGDHLDPTTGAGSDEVGRVVHAYRELTTCLDRLAGADARGRLQRGGVDATVHRTPQREVFLGEFDVSHHLRAGDQFSLQSGGGGERARRCRQDVVGRYLLLTPYSLLISDASFPPEGSGTVSSHHCDQRGDASALKIGLKARAQAVQLIGVPGQLQQSVERLDVDELADDRA